MKKIVMTLMTSGVLCMSVFNTVYAQLNSGKTFIGTTSQLLNQLTTKNSNAGSNAKVTYDDLHISVDPKTVISISTTVKKQKGNTNSFLGTVKSAANSSFFLSINGNEAEGKIILKDQKTAYDISSDGTGNVYVQGIDIDKVMCIDFKELPMDKRQKRSATQRNATNNSISNVYALQSFPGSAYVAYLDFDGEYFNNSGWNGGNPLDALPSGMADADILEAWEITSEDYRAFDLNITTDVNVFNKAQPGKRIRCVITPTNTAGPGYGGIAYIGGFTWTSFEEPCWAFTSGVGMGGKNVGEVCSHEIGHTLFLGHDGRTEPAEVYYAGAGEWAPIMGAGYYENIVQFSKGEYLNANNGEDDIQIIATQNGFSFREDDHDDNTSGATALIVQGNNVSAADNFGVISQRSDIDFFSFTTDGGALNLSFNAAPRHANLDILVKLYDQNYNLIDRVDQDGLNVTLSKVLKAGKYYVSVDGTGNGDPLLSGYTDYSSLGSYSISGTIPQGDVNLSPTVSITSPVSNQQFTASADIIIQAAAADSDGSVAKVEFYNGTSKLGEDVTAPYTYSWTNVASGNYSLVAKAIDDQGAIATSESITIDVIKATDHCAGTASWSASQVYAAPGQRVFYQGGIFENKWWTQNDLPDLSNPWGVWKYIAPCGSSILKPTVSFIAPTVTFFQAGNSTELIAAAADTDGNIQKVDFYENDRLISSSFNAPYSINKSSMIAGTYTIKAIATDNSGVTSDPALITLTVDALPTFISPLTNADYNFGGSINLQINPNGGELRITKVEYFFSVLSNKVGEVSSSPYSLIYPSLPDGTSSKGNYLPIVAKVSYAQGGVVVIDTYIHITNLIPVNLCTNLADYKENGAYSPGSTVKYSNKIYECRPWPYSGWCNSAAVAYAPGTGTAWQDAWIDKGSCTGNAKRLTNTDWSESVTVFPNPVSNAIQLNWTNDVDASAEVIIYDALGNVVRTNPSVNANEELDLSSLAAGIYNLRITINEETTYRKIVKH